MLLQLQKWKRLLGNSYSMRKFSELTLEEKQQICNGCGAKGGLIKSPDFLFKASCDHHDYYYYLGGTEADRKVADDLFYCYMREDIKDAKWYLKPYYKMWAYGYYLAVRKFGKPYFNYKDDTAWNT